MFLTLFVSPVANSETTLAYCCNILNPCSSPLSWGYSLKNYIHIYNKIHSNYSYNLKQCCPNLSPFATCGDRLFKCGDREFFQKLHFSRKVQQIAVFTAYFSQLWRQQRDCRHKSCECGDRNILVGHRWSKGCATSFATILKMLQKTLILAHIYNFHPLSLVSTTA